MGPGATYAVVTFLAGLITLLGWLYATADNPRSGAMLRKSFLLFVIPIVISPFPEFFKFPLGIWVWVACEEGLKVIGWTQEEKPTDKFWLISLFGIWELIAFKPVWGIAVAQSGESWDRLDIIGLAYATALPVLMHTVTAAIYAFTFQQRLWAAFIGSLAVHISFNEAAERYYGSMLAVVVETVVLASMLGLILRRWQGETEGEAL